MELKIQYPKKAGLYKLTCINNGKVYIGKTVNLRSRLNYHKRSGNITRLRSILKNAIMKHGWESFRVEILEIVENFDKLKDNESLLLREAYYIELNDSTNRELGYNLCSYSNDSTGIPKPSFTEEHKQKIRLARLGKPSPSLGHTLTEEHKEKLRQINTGKVLSEEHKEKMSLSMRGRKLSEETKEKLRQINLGKKMSDSSKQKMREANLGKELSEETKEKLRQINLGKRHSEETREKMRNVSDETRKKMREAKLGRKFTEEHKEKLRQAKLGKKLSEETKAKLRKPKTKKTVSVDVDNQQSTI